MRRSRLVAGALALPMVPGLLLLTATPASAASTCDALPGPARIACKGAAAVAGGVGGALQDATTSVAETAVGGIARSFAEAGGFFFGKLAELLGATTDINVGADWFVQRYALMFGISALLTFLLLLLSVLKAVLRGQGLEVVKSGTVHYLMAVVASAFAPALVYLLLQLSDAVSLALTVGAADDTKAFLNNTATVLATLTTANPAGGAATVLITAVLAIACSVILWVELLLRTAIIYVATLFAAPTFSGLVDRGLWKHSRRWVYFTVSVIFAKPVVVAVLSLAAAGAGAAGTSDGFSSVFVALALLIVAIFCVGLLFRIIPNAGDEIAGALNARREIKASTPNSPLPSPGSVVRQSMQSHLVRATGPSGGSRLPVAAAPPVLAASVVGATARSAGSQATKGVSTAVRAPGSAGGPGTSPPSKGPRR